jgi:glycosyltransferase involved in cell wall biosynthesis
MKILIVTDAFSPQINGVVTTLQNTMADLRSRGYQVFVLEPSMFVGFNCPGYNEIKLSIAWTSLIRKYLDEIKPDMIHIATEGPIGLMTRRVLRQRKQKWSSSFHTKFAEYVESRIGFGGKLVWKWLRWVYRDDCTILVTTPSMKDELIQHGFKTERLIVWGRGVDENVFHPDNKFTDDGNHHGNPIWLNVGRVSIEKNLEAFYCLDLPGRKIQVGDGPALDKLKEKYPNVEFVGSKKGAELAAYYRMADVFVFPSKSDTFGLVMIESMRCGTPVAAYPVTGPIDVVQNGKTGTLHDDLLQACNKALHIPRETVLDNSKEFTWKGATDKFLCALIQTK